jgi:hypothetical protein
MKLHTVDELVTHIYEVNNEHFEQAQNDCDCNVHTTIQMIVDYWDE